MSNGMNEVPAKAAVAGLTAALAGVVVAMVVFFFLAMHRLTLLENRITALEAKQAAAKVVMPGNLAALPRRDSENGFIFVLAPPEKIKELP